MSYPQLEINLRKLEHNARMEVNTLAKSSEHKIEVK